ncbi:hypothetical protein RFI_01281, partial [Reticulomyxa filosa]
MNKNIAVVTMTDLTNDQEYTEPKVQTNDNEMLNLSRPQNYIVGIDDDEDAELDGIVEVATEDSVSHEDFFTRTARMDTTKGTKIRIAPLPRTQETVDSFGQVQDKIIEEELSEFEDKLENMTVRSDFFGGDTQRTTVNGSINGSGNKTTTTTIITTTIIRSLLNAKPSNTFLDKEEQNNTSHSRTMEQSNYTHVSGTMRIPEVTSANGNTKHSPQETHMEQGDPPPHQPKDNVTPNQSSHHDSSRNGNDDSNNRTISDKHLSDHKIEDLASNTHHPIVNGSPFDVVDTTRTTHLTVHSPGSSIGSGAHKLNTRPGFENLRSMTIYFMGKGNAIKPSQKAVSKHILSAGAKHNVENMPNQLVESVIRAIDRSLAEVYTNLRDPFSRFQKTK